MMKITLYALATTTLVCALPQQPDAQPQAQVQAQVQAQPQVQIVKQESDIDVNGYNFEYETSDGTSRQEHGDYKNDTEQQGLLVRGSYKYVAPDGQHVSVTFVADKNGYQPTEHKGDEQNSPSQPGPQS